MAKRTRSKIPPTSSGEILVRIKEIVRSMVEDLSNNRTLSLAIDRYKIHCLNNFNCSCSYDLPSGKEIVLLQREAHAHRLCVFLRLLLIVQKLLQENKHGSKRDIYYMNPSLFLDQAVVDRAINDICILLNCSRHNLNVVPVGKGLVMGWLKFVEAGRASYCINNPNTAYPVPVCVEEVEGIVSVAQYILVVEKETVFQRLTNDNFCDKNRCIVITGRGYPDVPTRRFLHCLVDQLHLPVYCLVDADPYGFDILTMYRFGSMKIQWLGVLPSELETYQLPARCLIQLTAEDKKKAEAMMLRCYLQREVPQWRSELEIMLQKGVKFEIEALSVSSLSFLSEYIPAKINGGRHL